LEGVTVTPVRVLPASFSAADCIPAKSLQWAGLNAPYWAPAAAALAATSATANNREKSVTPMVISIKMTALRANSINALPLWLARRRGLTPQLILIGFFAVPTFVSSI
jgi:hypothetical protein